MRKIIHLDMDCFFAAVEMRDNPRLREVPIAIGGSASRRGVISTCNYPARAFGVRSAMATGLALKLCPQLTLLPHRMRAYSEASRHVFEIFQRYTDQVEGVSVDEAYLDVTAVDLPKGSATLLAQELRRVIEAETGLTASAGVAPNKLLAKLASERNKPNGLCTIAPPQVEAFMRDLPLGKLHGVGKVTADALKAHGFQKASDLWPLSRFELAHRLGRLGEYLYFASRGVDERPVCTEWERKSISVENTFARDLTDVAEMRAQLLELFADFMEGLADHRDRKVAGLVVKIKYFDFQQTTIERAGARVDAEAVLELFHQRWLQRMAPVRLLGVGVRFAEEEEERQLSFDSLLPTG